jgi:hypothetical protein
VKHAHINSLMHDRPDWRRRAVPIKLYGDGVPVTGVGKSWSKTMATYTFSSLVATGKTHEIVFLVWACMTLLANDSVTPAFDTKSRFCKKLAGLSEHVTMDVFLIAILMAGCMIQPRQRAGAPVIHYVAVSSSLYLLSLVTSSGSTRTELITQTVLRLTHYTIKAALVYSICDNLVCDYV